MVRALSGLWSYWISEGDFERCQVVSRQLIAQLDRSGVGGRVATVQSIRGTEAFWTGRLPEARTALLQAAAGTPTPASGRICDDPTCTGLRTPNRRPEGFPGATPIRGLSPRNHAQLQPRSPVERLVASH